MLIYFWNFKRGGLLERECSFGTIGQLISFWSSISRCEQQIVCERWIHQHDRSMGQRKKTPSPTGIKPTIFQTLGGHSIHWSSYENSWRARSNVTGFDFCRGLSFFSLSHAHVLLINSPSHFITEFKIHHLYSLITTDTLIKNKSELLQ